MALTFSGSYLLDTIKGKIKPHPFSWIIWVSISIIVFVAQLSDGAGAGAWMNGAITITGIMIVIASLKSGFGNITKWDIAIFILSLCSIPLWIMSDNALYAVILLVFINAIAYIPTFRKSYWKPNEEALYLYGFNVFRHSFSLLAYENYSFITILAPVGLVIINGIMALFLMHRRYRLK